MAVDHLAIKRIFDPFGRTSLHTPCPVYIKSRMTPDIRETIRTRKLSSQMKTLREIWTHRTIPYRIRGSRYRISLSYLSPFYVTGFLCHLFQEQEPALRFDPIFHLSYPMKILGLPEGTVKSRMRKAKEQLKEKLEAIGYDRCCPAICGCHTGIMPGNVRKICIFRYNIHCKKYGISIAVGF